MFNKINLNIVLNNTIILIIYKIVIIIIKLIVLTLVQLGKMILKIHLIKILYK